MVENVPYVVWKIIQKKKEPYCNIRVLILVIYNRTHILKQYNVPY